MSLAPDDQDRIDAARGHRIVGECELRLRDWLVLGSAKDRRDFKRLCNRLWMRRWYASLTPDERARCAAQCAAWKRANPKRWREYLRAWKKRARAANAPYYAREKARKAAKRNAARQARRAATVYTCHRCGAAWSPATPQLPRIPPKWCGRRCKAAVVYELHGEQIRARARARHARRAAA